MIRTLKSNRITDVGQILREGTPLLFSLSLRSRTKKAGQGRAGPPSLPSSLPVEYITVKKKRRKIAME